MPDAHEVAVAGPLTLGAFLKACGAASTGGHAKVLIQSGDVTVNGATEVRRGRRLRDGDIVVTGVQAWRVRVRP